MGAPSDRPQGAQEGWARAFWKSPRLTFEVAPSCSSTRPDLRAKSVRLSGAPGRGAFKGPSAVGEGAGEEALEGEEQEEHGEGAEGVGEDVGAFELTVAPVEEEGEALGEFHEDAPEGGAEAGRDGRGEAEARAREVDAERQGLPEHEGEAEVEGEVDALIGGDGEGAGDGLHKFFARRSREMRGIDEGEPGDHSQGEQNEASPHEEAFSRKEPTFHDAGEYSTRPGASILSTERFSSLHQFPCRGVFSVLQGKEKGPRRWGPFHNALRVNLKQHDA